MPPPLAPQVQPIIGNPNLRLDIELQTQRGNIASPKQRESERTTAIATGITQAVDNFFDIRKDQAIINQREALTKSTEVRNEREQLRRDRDLASQGAQLEIDKAVMAREGAKAVVAQELAEVEKDAFKLGKSTDALDRLELFTDPRFEKFLVDNPDYAQQTADQLFFNHPQFKETLDNNFYKKRDIEKERQAAKETLKVLDDSNRLLKKSYFSSPELSHIDLDRYPKAKIVSTDRGPDLKFLDDETLFSETLEPATDKNNSSRRKAINKAIAIHRQTIDNIDNRKRVLAQANGEDPNQVVTVEQENNQLEITNRLQLLDTIAERGVTERNRLSAQAEREVIRQNQRSGQNINLENIRNQIQTPSQVVEASTDSPALEGLSDTAKQQAVQIWNNNQNNVQSRYNTFEEFVADAINRRR